VNRKRKKDLAQEDRRIAATVDQWDTDPWLLNTPGGVVDLRTGRVRDHRPEDYMTKITAVAPDARCPTPLWDAFLTKVAPDSELRSFLARVAGYSLTGITREHALFFLYGEGRNGKSTFVSIISGILGEYHRTAPIETFIEKKFDAHPTELAMLQGARLVTATETEEGRRWNEARIKELTGGDKVAARFMRQDFFEFTPQFKLVIAGNNKPGLRSVDTAIRRRLNLLPFEVTIPKEEVDKELPEKLRKEWPGILANMIAGALDWQQRGLSPPKVVTDATDEYMEGEDAMGAWFKESFVHDVNGWLPSSVLFAHWKAWAEENEEFVGSSMRFYKKLSKRGLVPTVRNPEGRGYQGLEWLSTKASPFVAVGIEQEKRDRSTRR
jgi:putative DNA primase/helicase